MGLAPTSIASWLSIQRQSLPTRIYAPDSTVPNKTLPSASPGRMDISSNVHALGFCLSIPEFTLKKTRDDCSPRAITQDAGKGR